MPVFFVGHGSPLNAIEKNIFTKMLEDLGKKIPRPKAILVISAHWNTDETYVLGMEKPKTIHDFYGFPRELFDVQYPAAGSPAVAELIKNTVEETKVNLDYDTWGLDHGTWSILNHMYPKAEIPVLQLSLVLSEPAEYHLNIGKQLAKLRNQGILILASGNLVHNLRKLNWNTYSKPFDWAFEFDQWTKLNLETRNFTALMNDFLKTEAGRLSVPTIEHYVPLFYILGASDPQDELMFEFEEIHNASISMRTFGFWPK